MIVPPVMALALVLASMPISSPHAQTQPVRIVNNAPISATALFAMPIGSGSWSNNLLGPRTLRPGAFLPLQPGEGTGCLFDLRLVLRDGREVLRRDVDICVQRVVAMTPDAAPATADPPAPAAPAPSRPAPRP
jgi:hypothetical protein